MMLFLKWFVNSTGERKKLLIVELNIFQLKISILTGSIILI
jgi:hypothetical protein